MLQCVWVVACMLMDVCAYVCVCVCTRVGKQNGLRLQSDVEVGGGADGLNHCSGLV